MECFLHNANCDGQQNVPHSFLSVSGSVRKIYLHICFVNIYIYIHFVIGDKIERRQSTTAPSKQAMICHLPLLE